MKSNLTSEQLKELAERISLMKPGESVTVILENQKEVAAVRKEIKQQVKR